VCSVPVNVKDIRTKQMERDIDNECVVNSVDQ
jgi:hypothetical protein